MNFRMQLDNARDTMRSEFFNRRKNVQPLRNPHLSPISVVSLLYALSLFAFYQQGVIRGVTLVGAVIVIACFAILFYGAFRFGFNTRFHEPGLMLPQIFVAVLTMLAVAYMEPATQIGLVPFILIAFSFGVFRLSTVSLVLLSIGCLGAYLGIILLHAYQEHDPVGFRYDLINWLMLGLTLPGMIVVGRQIQNLHEILKATRYQLEHYEEKSIRDELTGLYNRRQLQAELEQARLQASTLSVPFSVCLIDIDHFKHINDSSGHPVGDTILRDFARVARESIRDTDIFGRYGGDEFLQILPDTDLEGAVMHAERLRVRTHFLDFQKILPERHISVSIGIAQYRAGERISDLIMRSDSALYRAKQLGRNRVEWLDEH